MHDRHRTVYTARTKNHDDVKVTFLKRTTGDGQTYRAAHGTIDTETVVTETIFIGGQVIEFRCDAVDAAVGAAVAVFFVA